MSDLELLEQDAPAPAAEPATPPASSETAVAPPEESGAPAAGSADSGPAPASPAAAPALEIQYPDEDEPAEEPNAAAEAKPADSSAAGDDAGDAAAGRHGPRELTKLISENEPLKAFLDTNPRVKSHLYQLARRSGELNDYQQLFPTLTRAKDAVASQRQLQELDRAYLQGQPQEFLSRLWEAQATTDPLTGQQVSSGVYERHVQFLHSLMLEALAQQAEESRDSKLQGAVETIREALGTTRPSPAQGDSLRTLPPSIRKRLADAERAAAELDDLRLRRSEELAAQQDHFRQEIVRDTAEKLDEFVRGLLANTGLNEYTQRAVARDFIERAAELADRDPVHAAAMEELFFQDAGPATRERLVAKALAWARGHAREILEPIVRGATEAARREQVERESARAARHRPEPSSVGTPAPPERPSVRDLIARREGNLKRRLSDREILDL